jgi:methylenetetrahydrofolate dehydrogenase (NADP+)/methenyltetrahydrofolate cyclohydrolase
VVIDVGVTEVDGELVGDVDFEAALGIASLITPSRRGIGPLTITMLLKNTLIAYRARKGV